MGRNLVICRRKKKKFLFERPTEREKERAKGRPEEGGGGECVFTA